MKKQLKLAEPEEIEGPYELPRGWRWVKLEEVCEINPRNNSLKDLPDTLEVTFVPMAAVDEEQGAITAPQIRQFKQVKRGYTQFKEGDVIFAKITPCMENGKAAVAKNLKNGLGFGSTEFHVLRPTSQTISGYIYLYIRQPSFRREAEMNMTGTVGQLRVPVKFMKDVDIPLPPLSEQKRIVTKLEVALSKANKAKEFLEESGKAIEKILPAAIKKAIPTRDPLPESWKWAKIFEVGQVVTGTTPRKRDKKNYGNFIPFVKPTDLNARFVTVASEYLSQKGAKIARIIPPRSVMVTSIGATIGKTGFSMVLVATNQQINSILSFNNTIPEFVYYYCISEYFQNRILEESSSTTLPIINKSRFEQMEIPFPPLKEQKHIATHLNEISERVDKLKELHKQASERVEKITTSILAKAFRGEYE